MHWLAGELAGLRDLAQRFSQLREQSADSQPLIRQSRADFHQALHVLVEQISRRPGVTACFAAHEGLIIAVEGRRARGEEEGWAAMAQSTLDASRRSARSLGLGELNQIVLVGQQAKLVLFPIEPVVLGLLGDSDISLSRSLAD